MKTRTLTLSALTAGFTLAAFTLIGCGGGATNSSIQTSKISGTVPGTLIEAFCTDGSYYSVKSTQNGTDKHPFEIEIPSNVSCSLVMTTNEDDNASKVVTQIGIITSDANGTLFTASADINLGNIPLAMDPADINDSNEDHVSDDIFNIEVNGTLIKIELENPLDDDHDGLVNIYEDDDNDSISNHDDEDYKASSVLNNDLDGDGISNDVDVDDDNDGINDDIDPDDDNDGINDNDDSDDDNDGIDDNDDNDSEENDENVVL